MKYICFEDSVEKLDNLCGKT